MSWCNTSITFLCAYRKNDAVAAHGSNRPSVLSGVSVVGGGVCRAAYDCVLECEDFERGLLSIAPVDMLRSTKLKLWSVGLKDHGRRSGREVSLEVVVPEIAGEEHGTICMSGLRNE